MTETQAAASARAAEAGDTAGAAGKTPDLSKGAAGQSSGGGSPADQGAQARGAASVAPAAAPAGPQSAAGRASVVGRASVSGDTGSNTKYTRAPGMPPPPDALVPSQGAKADGTPEAPTSGAAVTAPVVIGNAGRSTSGTGGLPPVSAAGRASARGAATVSLGAVSAASASARVAEAVRSTRAAVSGAAGRGPRRARLHIKRIDPWSTMKFSFAVSLVLFVVAIVATSVLYLALDAMGVFENVNKVMAEMIGSTGGDSKDSFQITAKGVVGGSALLGAVNVVLFTALATLGAFIYNVCADLVGGIELTLAEKD